MRSHFKARSAARRFAFALLFLLLNTQTDAQGPRCGVVDAIDYPIDGLVEGYDDFSRFRARFGGNHTGLDIGFDRWGDPVHAVARGRVTYSDVEGWDTEKGVVIVEHTFPDGSVAYTLYGHMEQTDTLLFPLVGQCVERGDIVGGIGWPSRGRPHLHYEIRDFLPNDGGPGYVTGNPREEGWYHPMDFTELWRARLSPGYISSVTFDSVPGLPPILLDSGQYVIASDNAIVGTSPAGEVLWRIEADGVITGLAGLPGDRVVAHTTSGQVITLQGGRYAALWTVEGPDEPFVALGETLVFMTNNGGLAAFSAAGAALWTLPGLSDSVVDFRGNGQQIALALRVDGDVLWRLVDALGEVLYETRLNALSAAAPQPDGQWLVLDGAQLNRVGNGEIRPVASIGLPPGRTAAMTADTIGNSYIFLDDAQRTLLAYGADGNLRWRSTYPFVADLLPPLLGIGSGCLLYALDANGALSVFNTADGTLLTQRQMYAGGNQTSSPVARLLRVDAFERVQAGAGFLTMLTLDGGTLGGDSFAACLLG